MAYTVKNLSELSGVTVRTLHFYEEQGILHPAYYGSNGYRYYENKQLLQLQQILFFKELGLSVKEIKKIISKKNFDLLASLISHKESLKKELQKIKILTETIDKTINHLQGITQMKNEEIFNGFNPTMWKRTQKQTSYAEDETIVLESLRETSKEPSEVLPKAVALLEEINSCLKKNLSTSSNTVQEIVARHYALTNELHHATQSMYKSLANLYAAHPAFKEQLSILNPKLPKFMSEAMLFFCEKELI